MSRPRKPTAERFVATTLELVEEQGGSLSVNLRQISRRMGCAHTNVYNYFDTYQDLLWEAFRRGLDTYGEYLVHDLSTDLDAGEYLRRAIVNLATFPEKHPGLYRLIGSDPIDVTEIPDDILEYVTGMKEWLAAAFQAAGGSGLDGADAAQACDIVLSYIDGETLNLLNGREIPSEDLRGRIIGNAERLVALLTESSGGNAGSLAPPDPQMIFNRRRKDQ